MREAVVQCFFPGGSTSRPGLPSLSLEIARSAILPIDSRDNQTVALALGLLLDSAGTYRPLYPMNAQCYKLKFAGKVKDNIRT